MSNNNVHILSTALLDEPLITTAAQQGITVHVVPFITVAAVSYLPDIDTLIPGAQSVVFTSANAVNIVGKMLQGQAPQWHIYCIGNATKQAVLQYFDEGAIAGAADNAVALATLMIGRGTIGNVLFFCGDKRRDELPVMLANSGIAVTEITVYTTVETPVKLETGYDGILFFSPSAVSSFFSSNLVAHHTVLFAIGATTAHAIKEHTHNTVVITGTPAKEEMIATVALHYNQPTITV